jgi:hypothetical protein
VHAFAYYSYTIDYICNRTFAGSFTSPSDLNLILAKNTGMEIYHVTPEGLRPIKEVMLYGEVSVMKFFQPAVSSLQLVFFCLLYTRICVNFSIYLCVYIFVYVYIYIYLYGMIGFIDNLHLRKWLALVRTEACNIKLDIGRES